jgi:hypothetical protein
MQAVDSPAGDARRAGVRPCRRACRRDSRRGWARRRRGCCGSMKLVRARRRRDPRCTRSGRRQSPVSAPRGWSGKRERGAGVRFRLPTSRRRRRCHRDRHVCRGSQRRTESLLWRVEDGSLPRPFPPLLRARVARKDERTRSSLLMVSRRRSPSPKRGRARGRATVRASCRLARAASPPRSSNGGSFGQAEARRRQGSRRVGTATRD